MKKYYKVAYTGVTSIPKTKELNSDSLILSTNTGLKVRNEEW